jgi:hypothetical protein
MQHSRTRHADARIGFVVPLAATLVLAALQPLIAATIHVQAKSPGDAAAKIQQAVDFAKDGDDVVLEKGTYILSAEIVISKPITLRGAKDQNATVLDGNHSNRCLRLAHSGAVLEDLTITHGSGAQGGGGGGIYCAAGTIRNCVITENDSGDSSGGGILVHGSLAIQNSTIAGNKSCVGGGIEVRGSLDMDTCIVSGNVARVDAGGLECGSNTVIRNSVFADNIAGRNGAGIDTSYRSSLSVVNTTLRGNKATSSVASHGGSLHITGTASANLQTCVITRNSSGCKGGGVFNADRLNLVGCTIENNTAGTEGGGIFNYPTRSVRAENCRIAGNSAAKGSDMHGELTSAGSTQIGSAAECTIVVEAAKQ